MMYLIAGLLIFLGTHSVRVFANDWRLQKQRQWGATGWRAAYALVSLCGLLLVIWGFGLARQAPVPIWFPPMGMRHLAVLLTLPAFVLLAAAYVPGNRIKARVHHPMTLGVKFWAVAHLLANGNLGHIVLFGSFLAWSVVLFEAQASRSVSCAVPMVVRSALSVAVLVAMLSSLPAIVFNNVRISPDRVVIVAFSVALRVAFEASVLMVLALFAISVCMDRFCAFR